MSYRVTSKDPRVTFNIHKWERYAAICCKAQKITNEAQLVEPSDLVAIAFFKEFLKCLEFDSTPDVLP